MKPQNFQYPRYVPNSSIVERKSSLIVSLHRGGPCMRFDARWLPDRRIFIESEFLYNTGKSLFLVVGNPGESQLDIPARVESVSYGDEEFERSGMLISLSPPGQAA